MITTAAFLFSACSASNPLAPVEQTTNLPPESSTLPQANVDQSANSTIDENTTLTSSEQTDQTSNATPPVGAASPTNNNSIVVEGLDPSTVVACGASSLHIQQRTLELINEARSEPRTCGTDSFQATDPLVWNTDLLRAAEKHSTDMAQHNFFDHTGSDGSSIGERVDETGYDWQGVGENIAAGQRSVSEAIAGWLNSPGHCRNLMDPTFTEVAVTCIEDDGADYTQYWTNVLATPQ